MEYNGELTFAQIFRIIKYDKLKWIICVLAAFIITFAATFSVFCATAKNDYSAKIIFAVEPSNPENEIAEIKSAENISAALKAEGFTDDEIVEKDLISLVATSINAYADGTYGTYVVSLSAPSISGFSDGKYNSLVNAIARAYTSSYRAENAFIIPSDVDEVDCSDMDYIAAADYIVLRYSAIYDVVESGVSGGDLATYIDGETGYTFSDIKNILSSLSFKIILFRYYVESNAAARSGAAVSAKEYILSRLNEYENLYEEKLFEYNSLKEIYNVASESSGFGTTTTSADGSTEVAVGASFYDLVEEIRAAAEEVSEAKTSLVEMRQTWTAFGGVVEYNADGSVSYVDDGFNVNYSTEAEEMLSDTISAVNEAFEVYSGMAARYNASVLSSGMLYISKYSSKNVTRALPLNMLVIINVAVVAVVFVAANTRSYIILKKNGAFHPNEEKTE